MKQQLKQFLEQHPKARERKHKNNAIAYFLRRDYPALDEIPINTLGEFVQAYNTADRMWRKLLDENEGLRGSDYEKKTQLSQNYQRNLGYEPGYNMKLPI